MYKLASISVLAMAGLASAQNVIDVAVGATGSNPFQFSPNNVTAKKGDVVRFTFSGAPGNHSVTQSSLAKPCDPLANGFDSGWVLIPNSNVSPSPEWNLTITDESKPLWFYCKQLAPAPHCGVGMLGAINANDTAMTSFMDAAKGNTNPGQGVGALVGVGASASAAPGPLNNGAALFGTPAATAASGGSSPSGTDSSSGASQTSGSGNGNGASTFYISGFAAVLAAVMGISLA